MAEKDTSELEQIRQTAEMFEMILQSTPGALENYESLKDAYRKLKQPDKVKEVYLRLASHHAQCRDFDKARAELKSALNEFPSDPAIQAKLDDLGPVPSRENFYELMSQYEDLCIRFEDIRLRVRIAEAEMHSNIGGGQDKAGEELGNMEDDYRQMIDELALAENEKVETEERIRAAIEALPEDEQSHAEAEFVALSGDLEIITFGEDASPTGEMATNEGDSRLDVLERRIEG